MESLNTFNLGLKNREETANQYFDSGMVADESAFLQEEDKDLDDLYDKVIFISDLTFTTINIPLMCVLSILMYTINQ